MTSFDKKIRSVCIFVLYSCLNYEKNYLNICNWVTQRVFIHLPWLYVGGKMSDSPVLFTLTLCLETQPLSTAGKSHPAPPVWNSSLGADIFTLILLQYRAPVLPPLDLQLLHTDASTHARERKEGVDG